MYLKKVLAKSQRQQLATAKAKFILLLVKKIWCSVTILFYVTLPFIILFYGVFGLGDSPL